MSALVIFVLIILLVVIILLNRKKINHHIIVILFIVLLVIGIPIAINYILQIPTPRFTSIVGDSTNWLSFWGAFLGGILTAGFGVYTSWLNQRESKVKEHKRLVEDLKRDLSNRSASLNTFELHYNLDRLETIGQEQVSYIIIQLSAKKHEIEGHQKSWSFISLNNYLAKPKDFDVKYYSCLSVYLKCLDDIIELLNRIQRGLIGADYSEDVEKLKQIIEGDLDGQIEDLTEEIKKWISEEYSMILE